MKARVKATGEIIEVTYLTEDKNGNKYYGALTDTRTFRETELEMISDKGDYFYTYDYWTRLEHQYAGMAMQGLCANRGWDEISWADMAEDAIRASRTLIQKLKEKEERK